MKYYIGNIEADPDFLEHHGILGMKWGQRNGPSYPLDASDHSAAEKKAGWRKSLGDAGTKAIAKTKNATSSVSKAAGKVAKKVYDNEVKRGQALKKSPRFNTLVNVVSLKQGDIIGKSAFIGASIVTTILTKNPTTGVKVGNAAYAAIMGTTVLKTGRRIVDANLARYDDYYKKQNRKKQK